MPIFPSLSKLFGTPPVAKAESQPQTAAATATSAEGVATEVKAVAVEKKRRDDSAAAPARTVAQRLHHPTNPDRTLSHVFTQLPKNLPNRADIHVDVLEYLMHVALLQTDPVKLHQHILDIDVAITNVDATLGYGRLHSRMHLTAFYADVCDKTTEMKMGPGLPTSSSCPTFELSQWKRCHKEFISLRQALLRKDANVVVPIQVMARRSSLGSHHKDDVGETSAEGVPGAEPPTPPPPPENAEIDTELEQHPMMQADYEEVLLLFAVQDAMADLQIALQNIQKDRPRNVTSLVKAALQSYHEALKSLFENPPVQLTFTSSLGGQKQSALVSKLSQTIQDVCLNDDNVYSYAQLQQKTRTLLIKWSESILEIPTLFELGYGGVMAPVVEQCDGDDDVSSFGQEEDEARLETQAPDPLPFRRTKYTHSPPKDAAFGSTPDEQIVLEQLSRGASPLREAEPLMPLVADQNGYESPHKDQFITGTSQDDDDGGFPTHQDDDDDELAVPEPLAPSVAGHGSGGDDAVARASSDGEVASGVDSMVAPTTDVNATAEPGQRELTGENTSRQPSNKRKEREEPDLCADSDESSLFNHQPKEKSRRTKVRWTDDETDAVVEGVTLFGPGKWTKLKQWAGARLQNRDPVSIKDKWRNLERSSIDASLLAQQP